METSLITTKEDKNPSSGVGWRHSEGEINERTNNRDCENCRLAIVKFAYISQWSNGIYLLDYWWGCW